MKEILLKWLSNSNKQPRLSADEIDVRVRAFVVIVVTLIFAFITFALLYSVTFVTQPIKQMAPIDQAYTKMLNDIVLLIVGGIGGILTKGLTNEAKAMMDNVKAGKDAYVAPPVKEVTFVSSGGGSSCFNSAPPPPTLESDEERMRTATARESTRV